jgi:hypothetical protein
MKNSAWYHKLWRKKLGTLPVPDNAGAAWAGMKTLLDKNMPAGNGPGLGRPVKPLGAKLVTLLTYILPVAAIIGAGLYFLQLKHKKDKPQPKMQVAKLRDSLTIADTASLTRDSLFKAIPITDTIKSVNGTSNVKTPVLPIDTNHPVNNIGHKVKQSTASGIAVYQPQIPFTKNTQKGGASGLAVPIRQSLTTAGASNSSAQMNINNTQNGSKPAQGGVGADVTGTDNKPNPVSVSSSNDKPDNRGRAGSLINMGKQKNKAVKSKKLKNKQIQDIVTPPYNYGLELGLNTRSNTTAYFGMFGTYALSKRWLVNAGLRINTPRQLSGEYTHASYISPDTLKPFKITDTRKIMVLDIPVNLEYKISNLISIKAGPVISFAVKQSAKNSKVTVNDLRDTVYHSKQIAADLNDTKVTKVNVGFNGGISFHLKQFDINGQYQVLTPYSIKSNLGAYRNTYHTFQVGVGYRFK